jgi:hypothetical protein
MDDAKAKADLHRGTSDDKRQAMSIRSVAVEMAIKANIGQSYDDEGRNISDANRIVEAAKKFEAFIKG